MSYRCKPDYPGKPGRKPGKGGPGRPENLVPFSAMTPERAFEIRSAGGKATAARFARQRTFAEALHAMLSQPLPEGVADDTTRAIIDARDDSGKPESVQDAVVASLLLRAITGDKTAVEACKLILAQIGEATPEKQEITVVAGSNEVTGYMG